MALIKLQPWRAIKVLFGYSADGNKQSLVMPHGMKNLAMNMYTYGKDPLSTWYARKVHLTQDRLQAYKEFDDMDSDDVVVSALDLYAEDSTQADTNTGRRIWVEAEDEKVEEICNDMFDRINADEQCFSITREIAKYGNSFGAVIQEENADGTPGKVIQLLAAPVYALSRIEDEEGRLIGFAVAPIEQMGSTIGMAQPSDLTQGKPTDPPWAFVHWRLLGRERIESYGTSLLWPARRPYRRLRMAEDALVIYRLKRSPDRFVFGIKGLSGMAPEDRQKIMRKIRQELRKKHLINPETGQVRSELEPLGVDEDIIVDEESVNVTRLTGSAQVNHVLDIEYLRKRFMGSLKIPPDYLGFSDAKSGFIAESPLSYQDINFARVCKRLQAASMDGFSLLCQINMAWCGIDPRAGLAKFFVHMNPVSSLDERNQLELEKVRAETLEILTKVGAALGIDSDEWHAFLLNRSRLPSHLFRKSGKDGMDLLRGQVMVEKKPLDESKCESIEESLKTSDKVTVEEKQEFNQRLHGLISLREWKEVTEYDEEGSRQIKIIDMVRLLNIRELFSPALGSNIRSSNVVLHVVEDQHIPLSVPGTDKKLLEAKTVTEWNSEDKKTEVKKTKDLMERTIEGLKKKQAEEEDRQRKLQELSEKYGIDPEDFEEFDLEEEDDEEDAD